jgi:Ca-activated chloride channel family protein
LILALAQPRWNSLSSPKLPPGHDVVLAIDVSRSMAAEDAVPNRLALALESARSLVAALAASPADRAAVVAFAGRAVLVCPLTENLGAVLDSLKRLEPGLIQPGGSDLGQALDASLQALDPHQPHAEGRAIVLFTDGEDHTERWRSRLDRLKDEDIAVHAVAVGDADRGYPIPTGPEHVPLTFEGKDVLTRRSDTALDEITRQSSGALVRLGLTSTDLGLLYRARIAPAATIRRAGNRLIDRIERFPLFLGAAALFLAGGCWRTTHRPTLSGIFGRKTRSPSRVRARPKLKAAAAALLALSLVSAQPVGSSPNGKGSDRERLAAIVTRGLHAYEAREFERAITEFQSALAVAPEEPVLAYDTAATLFQLGRYAEAAELYQSARQRAGAALRIKIDFTLGNSALAQGDLPAAISSYDACIASTISGPALDAIRRDAAVNRQFALEQAQAMALAQAGERPPESEGNRDRNRTPNSRNAEGPDPDDPSDDSPGGPNGSGRDSDPNAPNRPQGRRRSGGAGGAGKPSSPNSTNTPEDRLDRALENIQNARSRRLPDKPTNDSSHTDRKDW